MAGKKAILSFIAVQNMWSTSCPKVKLEVVTTEEMLEKAIEAIQSAAKTGRIGDGKIFVSDISEVIRIRTGETGQGSCLSANYQI